MRLFVHLPSVLDVGRPIRGAMAAIAVLAAASLAGCGGSGDTSTNNQGSAAGGGGSGTSAGGDLFSGGSGGNGTSVAVPPDSSFVPSDFGSYALGDAIDGQGVDDTGLMGGA